MYLVLVNAMDWSFIIEWMNRIQSKTFFSIFLLQEGHVDMVKLLIKHSADVDAQAKNGLAPIHLCAQEDRTNVAEILVSNGADMNAVTKAGYR